MRCVLDTNIFVSAFFWDGNEAKLLREIEKGKAQLYVTQEILNEIETVIKRPKFKQIMKKADMTSDQIMQKIISLSHIIPTKKKNISICRDKHDEKFLVCAFFARANYIVSGDDDLLSLKKFNEIPIIRAKNLLEILE